MPRLESGAWSCSCAARARHAARPGEAAPKADAMQSPSPSAGRAEREASGGSATTWRQHLVQRSVVLFVVGAFMALVLNLLQIQRNVTLFPDEVIATLFSSAWWVPPCCGTAAGECRAPPSPPPFTPAPSRGWLRETPLSRSADRAARSRRGAPRARPAAAPRAAIGRRRTGEALAALPIGCRRQQATGRADNKEVTCGVTGAGLCCLRTAGTGCGGLGWKRGASERCHLGA